MAKERDMIETVDYDVGYPLSYRFLRRFGRVSQMNEEYRRYNKKMLLLSLCPVTQNVYLILGMPSYNACLNSSTIHFGNIFDGI